MSITNEQIIETLSGLDPDVFNVHEINEGWYTDKSLLRAVGSPIHKECPSIKTVRVRLSGGLLEFHAKDNEVNVMCYCCFGGDPDKGSYTLDKLKDAVLNLRDHKCPPWPG